MPNSPTGNNSFIPKQGPERKARKTASRQIHLFTVGCYVVFLATLIASAAAFFYGRYVDNQLAEAVKLLDIEIASFKIADMTKVQDFNVRLKQAENRLSNSVSLTPLFTALETSTVDTAKIVELNLEREFDESYSLLATIETDSFDSSIFQRSEYNKNNLVDELSIENVQILSEAVDRDNPSAVAREVIQFSAEVSIPLSSIPYQPTANLPINTTPVAEPAATNETFIEDDINNNDSL